jgi:hypothetical protein
MPPRTNDWGTNSRWRGVSHDALRGSWRKSADRPFLQRHIHDHGDGKESFAWEYGHQGKRRTIKIVSLRGQYLKAPLKQSRAKFILTPLNARSMAV